MNARRRRARVRASDLAKPKPFKNLSGLFFVALTLVIVIAYKTGIGEGATELLDALGLDPQTQLPASVLDRSPERVIDTALLVRFRDERRGEVSGCVPAGSIGQYIFDVSIDEAGRATRIEPVRDDLDTEGAAACIDAKARRWQMPRSWVGARVRVVFNFSPRREQ